MAKSLELPVADDYTPSAGELNNFVYLVCKYTVGWIPRSCDHDICVMMAGGSDNIKGNEGLSELCMHTCEFCWDHIAGEPEEFDADKLFDHIKPILNEWYANSTVEDRAKTE
jgi:hypothetical protein